MPREVIEAPMTGKIISITVKIGDIIEEEGEICILESMKMENPIVAPIKGKVAEMGVVADQVIAAGRMICIIEY